MNPFSRQDEPQDFLTNLENKFKLDQRLVDLGFASSKKQAHAYTLYAIAGAAFLILIGSLVFLNTVTDRHSVISPQNQALYVQQMQAEAQILNGKQ